VDDRAVREQHRVGIGPANIDSDPPHLNRGPRFPSCQDRDCRIFVIIGQVLMPEIPARTGGRLFEAGVFAGLAPCWFRTSAEIDAPAPA
jgi:hypothetical protein